MSPSAGPDAAKQFHVVLVEDDPAMGRLVQLVLSGGPYRVTACTGRDAVPDIVAEDPADLVLVDVAMPSYAEQLEVLGWVRNTPVVVLTDIDNEALLVDCLQAGAFDILLKPFAPDQLEQCVGLAVGADVSPMFDMRSLKAALMELDFTALRATRSGISQSLSLSEWRFLAALAARPGQPVLYQEILRRMYGRVYAEYPRLLQTWAERLKKKVAVSEFLGVSYALTV